jgi:uncharacterized protein
LLSAAAFGIYHWFSYNILGNPVQMTIIFLTTGVAGYIFAMAFQRTHSMYLPFGLHFGMDFAMMALFSSPNPKGVQLLLKSFPKDPVSPGSWISALVILLYFLGFPVLTYLGLRRIPLDA